MSKESVFEDVAEEPTSPAEEITSDLSAKEKAEFARLIHKSMSLPERARKLCELARLKGEKGSAVALRAIQIMNEMDGFTSQAATEVSPMFLLPEGTAPSHETKIPKK